MKLINCLGRCENNGDEATVSLVYIEEDEEEVEEGENIAEMITEKATFNITA